MTGNKTANFNEANNMQALSKQNSVSIVSAPVHNTATASMTSLEIANMLGKRHADIKRSIERLADSGVIQLSPMAKVKNDQARSANNTCDAYLFEGDQGKRDTFVIVAQNSPEFMAQIVDRWMVLEQEFADRQRFAALPDFTNPSEAAHAWGDQYERAHKAEAAAIDRSRVADSKTFNAYPLSHLIGGTKKQAGEASAWLVANGYIRKKVGRGGKHLGYIATEKGKDFVIQSTSQVSKQSHVMFTPAVLDILPDGYKYHSPIILLH